MSDIVNKENSTVEKLVGAYLESLPKRKHTVEEQDAIIGSIVQRTKERTEKSKSKYNIFEVITDRIRKLVTAHLNLTSRPYIKPALTSILVIASLVIISIIIFNKNEIEKEEISVTQREDTKSQDEIVDLAPTDAKKIEANEAIEDINMIELNQLSFLPLRLKTRAFSDTETGKYISEAELFSKLIKISTDILIKNNINIVSRSKNKIITQWYTHDDNAKQYKSRIIINEIHKDHPGLAFIEEKAELKKNDKIKTLNVNMESCLKEIKVKYYNSHMN